MNLRLLKQKSIKEKLGVTLTDNMSIVEITKALSKISPSVLTKLPEVQLMIFTYNALIAAQKGLNTTAKATKVAYTEIQDLIEDATALLTGNIQQPALKIASITAKEATKVEALIVDKQSELAVDVVYVASKSL